MTLIEKLTPFTTRAIKTFTATEEEELYVVEEVPKPKLSNWEIFMLILTVYSVIVSITLNTNESLRTFLGFKKGGAGMVSTIFSVLMILIFGPVLYLLALLTKFFESFGSYLISTDVSITKTWVEGLAYVAKNQQGLIAQLMTPFTWF
jgi:hypothetical protein